MFYLAVCDLEGDIDRMAALFVRCVEVMLQRHAEFEDYLNDNEGTGANEA